MKRQAWKRMQAWLLVVAMLVSVVTGIGTTKTAKAATKMGVTYTVHVQTYGDQQGWVHDGTMAGTKGQAKRLEEIRVKLTVLLNICEYLECDFGDIMEAVPENEV